MKTSVIRFSLSGQTGYSLIELLVVIAILGIVAGIGYPSYNHYVMEARRGDGHLALMNAVQSMERCRSTQYSYENCALPTHLSESDDGNYDIAVTSTASTYKVTATAKGRQLADNACATLFIDDKSTKGFTGAGPCW